jgi:uncharacterized protein (DUF1499 family)
MNTRIMTISIALPAALFAMGCTGSVPSYPGIRDGRLSPCPPTPNCVTSEGGDREHAVAPLRFTGTATEARAALRNVVLGMKRAAIVADDGDYIHAEFTSAVFRFVDDVEFRIDARTKVIQVRSASRLGSSDFGVNRKRVEEIRARWKQAGMRGR